MSQTDYFHNIDDLKTGIKREEAIPKDCVKPVITSPELELV